MNLSQISDTKVLETLREIVAEQPDYVYKSPEHQRGVFARCFYVHTDPAVPHDIDKAVAGCLVGHVLNRLGVSLLELKQHEGEDAKYAADNLGLGSVAGCVLQRAQGAQDDGETWAGALATAEAVSE